VKELQVKRVLLVNHGLGVAGAERQLALLAASLPPPYVATVFTLDEEDGYLAGVLRERGVDVRGFPRRSRFDVLPAPRMWSAARQIGPDLVHSWSWMTTLTMLPYCRATGVPLLEGSIRHGSLPTHRAWVSRLGVRLADKVVANSGAGLRAFGVPESRGRVVHNGFDEARLASIPPGLCGPFGEPGRPTTIVMAARMYPEKDWATFMEVARRLSRRQPGSWRFVGIGEGPDLDAVRAAGTDLVSAGTLTFVDFVTEVLPIVAQADVGVLLTDSAVHAEGCSNSIMEYMAAGLPVVCTDSGGNGELVADGATGLIVPAHDADLVVEALAALRSDPVSARAMGQAGRTRVLSEFSVGSMVAGYLSAYDWCCDG
jgi:glycosyltransferase involved in cell wall biosynthesis